MFNEREALRLRLEQLNEAEVKDNDMDKTSGTACLRLFLLFFKPHMSYWNFLSNRHKKTLLPKRQRSCGTETIVRRRLSRLLRSLLRF